MSAGVRLVREGGTKTSDKTQDMIQLATVVGLMQLRYPGVIVLSTAFAFA